MWMNMRNGEIFLRGYRVLDKRRSSLLHARVLFYGVVSFSLFAWVLYIICSLDDGLGLGLVLLGGQLIFGLSFTRLYHRFGMLNKEQIRLKDPSSLDEKWASKEIQSNTEEIERLFERILAEVERTDKSKIDDLNDVAWFGIVVWSMLSSLFFVSFESLSLFCIIGSPVIGMFCVATYLNGYKTTTNDGFEDDILHLEYHIKMRLKSIQKIVPRETQPFIAWKQKNHQSILEDIGLLWEPKSDGESDGPSLKYYIGLPSEMPERFEIRFTAKPNRNLIDSLAGVGLVTSLKWKIAFYLESSDPKVVITNKIPRLVLADRATLVRDPEDDNEIIQKLTKGFSEILDVLE
jgi:hypothetical protein